MTLFKSVTLLGIAFILGGTPTIVQAEMPSTAIAQTSAVEFYNRGVDKANKKDYKGAIADYTQAIQLNPKYAIAYLNRGVAYRKLKNDQKALADYSQAIQLKPNYSLAYYNRGNVRDDLNNPKGAIEDYTQAIEIDQEWGSRGIADAYYNRAYVQARLKQRKGALADYQKAADLYKAAGQTEDYEDAMKQVRRLQ
ncbi:MAG: tetratricopeptide repeat protein [Leptolyngbyaceae bacterium]|nr:tetratricopeptide repeat protein [Leptolyngbyaceae bacterium]